MSPPRRIVIVGGGFAGLHLLRRLEPLLRTGAVAVTLVDRNNFHLFTPLLYQVATGELPPHAVAYPLRLPVARAGQRFIQTEVEAVDIEAKSVATADGPLAYDQLVLVPGSVSNDFRIPGVSEHALPMKTLADGLAVRRAVLSSFERALRETDAARRSDLLSFIIIGGGPVGVELASSLRDLMDHTLRPMYPEIDFARDVAITLIDAAPRVIAAMDPRLSVIATRRLREQRVRLVQGSVSAIEPGRVLTRDAATFSGATVIWAGGVRPSPLLAGIPLPTSSDGRLIVDATFRAGGRDDVLSFGDAAAFSWEGRLLPQLAQVAVLQAPAVADAVARIDRGEQLTPFAYHRKGDLIALGRNHAGAELARAGSLVVGGLPAWTLWRANYLMQLLGVRHRATLLAEWTLSYFFSRMVAMTDEDRSASG